MYDWALATLEPHPGDDLGGPGGSQRWLLVRRSLTLNEQGELELAFYLCFGPAGTAIAELIRVAGARWAIEECFASAKNETGLDHYQVRHYDAWHRHITLAMIAAAYLAVTAATSPNLQIYPSPAPEVCSRCSHRSPCLILNQGQDPTAELAKSYRPRPPEPIQEGRLGGVTWSMNRGAAPPPWARKP